MGIYQTIHYDLSEKCTILKWPLDLIYFLLLMFMQIFSIGEKQIFKLFGGWI